MTMSHADDVAMPRIMTGQVDGIHTPDDLVGKVVSFMLTTGSQVSGVLILGVDTHNYQKRLHYRLPSTAGGSAVPVVTITHLHVAVLEPHTVDIGTWSSVNTDAEIPHGWCPAGRCWAGCPMWPVAGVSRPGSACSRQPARIVATSRAPNTIAAHARAAVDALAALTEAGVIDGGDALAVEDARAALEQFLED